MSSYLDNKRLLSVEEAAEYYGCHPDTIRRQLKAGSIQCIKLGRVFRISRKVLDDMIESQARLPVPPRSNNAILAKQG